ncbi:hypothetical protein SAMN05421812_1207 [Asanoa hainanensis]|uniref:Uncharacterized protein n=1 Tax=Asanoa hainanensis TaxID=560556 RepID=A0A239PDU4_9ACTN|nr:hypothetical protein SAMN05421812_1207 [Asanoa hainanensis]
MVAFLAALALLAVIGGAGGWIYGAQVADERAANRQVEEIQDTPSVVQEAPPRGEDCPRATQEAAGAAGSPGGLTEVLYIRTEDDRQVWICQDTAGTLFYQGYIGPADGDFIQGENALFLTTVDQTDGGYLATNQTDQGTTTYSVTPYRLTQTTNGKDSTFPVTERRP